MNAALAFRYDGSNGREITLTRSRGGRRSVEAQGAAALTNKLPSWYSEAVDRLMVLINLPDGWDGHNGKPTAPASAVHALEVLGRIMEPGLPLPSIMPLSNGGVQLEWHRKGWDVEMEFLGGPRVEVFVHNLATGEDRELDLDADLSQLGDVTARIRD